MPSISTQGRAFRHVFACLVVTSLCSLCLGAGAIDAWAQRLPDAPLAPQAQAVAARWDSWMQHARLIVPYDRVRAAERWVEHFRFAPPPD